MEAQVREFATNVRMSGDEAKEVCRLDQGENCCAFLTVDSDGFNCVRLDYPTNSSIFSRLDEGTMNAKGLGGWKGCFWEGKL